MTALGRLGANAAPVLSISVGPKTKEPAEWDEAVADEVGQTLQRLLPHLEELEVLEFVTCVPSWDGWLVEPNREHLLVFIS